MNIDYNYNQINFLKWIFIWNLQKYIDAIKYNYNQINSNSIFFNEFSFKTFKSISIQLNIITIKSIQIQFF